uniref:Uncharacterized protein n=1 Tax=Vespula pensylvanica TaxID=30213 RepID=A0A834K4X5_VESPE|nr:hypothetical protein H0235_015944 [Vespula pensylvanica]
MLGNLRETTCYIIYIEFSLSVLMYNCTALNMQHIQYYLLPEKLFSVLLGLKKSGQKFSFENESCHRAWRVSVTRVFLLITCKQPAEAGSGLLFFSASSSVT